MYPRISNSPSNSISHRKSINTLISSSNDRNSRKSIKRINLSSNITSNLPGVTFVVESSTKKGYYWYVKQLLMSKMKLLSLKKVNFEQASNDERFLWFVKENDSRIYSAIQEDGINLVIDYHDYPFSMDVRRSLIVRKPIETSEELEKRMYIKKNDGSSTSQREKTTPNKIIESEITDPKKYKSEFNENKLENFDKNDPSRFQHFNIIQRSMASGYGAYVSIQNLYNLKYIQYWTSWMQGRRIVALKKKLMQNKEIGEWKIIPVIKQVYIHENLMQRKMVRLPLNEEATQWFQDIKLGKSPEEMRERWDIKSMLHLVDEFGNNSLMICESSKNMELLDYLIKLDSPDNYLYFKNEFDQTLLHLACYNGNEKLVEKLCYLGADLYCVDKLGSTPFFDAIEKDRVSIVEMLLKIDPKIIDTKNLKQENAVHHAVIYHSKKCLKAIIEFIQVTVLLFSKESHQQSNRISKNTNQSHSSLNDSISKNQYYLPIITSDILNSHDKIGFSPLHHAVNSKQIEIIHLLLDNGANFLNPSKENGNTPLHLAIKLINPSVLMALMIHYPQNQNVLFTKNNHNVNIIDASIAYGVFDLIKMCFPKLIIKSENLLKCLLEYDSNPIIPIDVTNEFERKRYENIIHETKLNFPISMVHTIPFFRIGSIKFQDLVLSIHESINLEILGKKYFPIILKPIEEYKYTQMWIYWNNRIISIGMNLELNIISDSLGCIVLVASQLGENNLWKIDGNSIENLDRKLYMYVIDDPYYKLTFKSNEGFSEEKIIRFQPRFRMVTLDKDLAKKGTEWEFIKASCAIPNEY